MSKREMSFGECFQALRIDHYGLTQPEMALRLGVNQATVSRIEHGSIVPSRDIFMRAYAMACDRDVDLAQCLWSLAQKVAGFKAEPSA